MSTESHYSRKQTASMTTSYSSVLEIFSCLPDFQHCNEVQSGNSGVKTCISYWKYLSWSGDEWG